MTDYPPAKQATPADTLESQIMDSSFPKNDREWWAQREIERLRKIIIAARNLSDCLEGGFVVCENCGEQESTTDIDGAKELRVALGIEPDLTLDDNPF